MIARWIGACSGFSSGLGSPCLGCIGAILRPSSGSFWWFGGGLQVGVRLGIRECWISLLFLLCSCSSRSLRGDWTWGELICRVFYSYYCWPGYAWLLVCCFCWWKSPSNRLSSCKCKQNTYFPNCQKLKKYHTIILLFLIRSFSYDSYSNLSRPLPFNSSFTMLIFANSL